MVGFPMASIQGHERTFPKGQHTVPEGSLAARVGRGGGEALPGQWQEIDTSSPCYVIGNAAFEETPFACRNSDGQSSRCMSQGDVDMSSSWVSSERSCTYLISMFGLCDKPRPMWSRGTEMHGMPGVKCRRRGRSRSSVDMISDA